RDQCLHHRYRRPGSCRLVRQGDRSSGPRTRRQRTQPRGTIMRHRTIKGARLTLRPIEGRDAEAMFDLTSDVEGMRRIGINYTLTRDQVEQWAATVADATGRIDLAIVTDD